MIRVPASKFRRELRKWIRYVDQTSEAVIITQRFGPDLLFIGIVK